MANLRTLDLSVPIAQAIDPAVWRKYYGFAVSGATTGATSGSGLIGKYAALCGVSATEAEEAAATINEVLTDDAIRWHLRAALSELQVKLGVPMGITVIKSPPIDEGLIQGVDYDKVIPRRPYTHGEAEEWYRIDVPGPILSVERVRAFYYGQLIWEFSSDRDNINLIRTEWEVPGSMHILPINFQSVIVTKSALGGPGNYGVWHTLGAHRSPVPDFWGIDYTRGPLDRETGTPTLPVVLVDWVMSVAGVKLLSMEGIARSKGLTSTSVSFDGLSRSVGLQASAIYGLNSALEEVLRRNEERIDWKRLALYMKGLKPRMYSY